MSRYVITLTEAQRREVLIALSERQHRLRLDADETDAIYSQVLCNSVQETEEGPTEAPVLDAAVPEVEAPAVPFPCPFCGSKSLGWLSDARACYLSCVQCRAKGPREDTDGGAVARWNTRYLRTAESVLSPQWTTEPPKEDGYYWVRDSRDRYNGPEIAELRFHNGTPYIFCAGDEGGISTEGIHFWPVPLTPPSGLEIEETP